MSCEIPTFCNPPNFAVLFPDLVGATGPSAGLPAPLLSLGAIAVAFMPGVTQLTGVGASALAAIPTVAMNAPYLPYMVVALIGGAQQWWILTVGTTPTGPGVQQPNDYNASTNAKIWTQVA